MENEILERVVKAMNCTTGHESHKLNRDTLIIVLNLDILDEAEFAVALEVEFNIEIPDEIFEDPYLTLGGVSNFILNKMIDEGKIKQDF